MLFESEDTESPKLVYDCSDEDFENAFINSKRFRKGFSRDPTVKQKLDSAGYPVGNVRHTDGKHQDVSDTTIVLWSPKKGDVFMINAYKDKWGCSSHWDNSLAFPLAFPSYPS